MCKAIYNSGIPEAILKSVNRVLGRGSGLRLAVLCTIVLVTSAASGADWSTAEQQLAKKIVGVTGPGTVAFTVENRSSLGRRDADIVQNGLRSALEQAGIHFAGADQAAASVTLSLSENQASYVWVAQIHQGAGDAAVVMVSLPRSGHSVSAHDSMPITLRKVSLWTQDDRILDVAVLEENGAPTRIAVLDAENLSIHRLQNGKWELEQAAQIIHTKPWPLDVRGRVYLAPDHSVTAYLPGVICHMGMQGATATMNCHAGEDPWPIVPGLMNTTSTVFPSAGSTVTPSAAIPPLAGFFAPSRNYFNGVLSPAIGKFGTVPKFFSAAFVPRDKYTLWLFASVDGKVHLVDGMSDQTSALPWGSEIATVKTPCGAGWQVLATSNGEQAQDAVRAYEFPDRDPAAVSQPVELPGPLSDLWAESKGDTAIAIVKNRDTGSYEAFRLLLACGQ